jgi:hypothetical protein
VLAVGVEVEVAGRVVAGRGDDVPAGRPALRWSSEEKYRARLYGSVRVVETVPMSPMCSVVAASAESSVSGSKLRAALCRMSGKAATPSARKTESNRPRSAVRASAT